MCPAQPTTPARYRLPGPAGTMLPARCVRLLTPHLLLVLVQLSPARGHRTSGPRVSAPRAASPPAEGDEVVLPLIPGAGVGGREVSDLVRSPTPAIYYPVPGRASWRSCKNKIFSHSSTHFWQTDPPTLRTVTGGFSFLVSSMAFCARTLTGASWVRGKLALG